ncbi:MAG: hypothetical protein QOI54_2005 [Actinomycetota bacterium]|jgi:hypothetical protein|nr:hypothetical protein [Actinomycetota bacterium]
MGHSTIAITADLYTHLFETEDDALASRLETAFLTGHQADRTVVSLPRATSGCREPLDSRRGPSSRHGPVDDLHAREKVRLLGVKLGLGDDALVAE